MTLVSILLLLLIAAIAGTIGQALAGYNKTITITNGSQVCAMAFWFCSAC